MKETIEPWAFEIRQDKNRGYTAILCYKCITNTENEMFKVFEVN